jgi:hypothetical protein
MKPTLKRFLTRLSKQGNRVGRKFRALAITAALLLSGIGVSGKLSAQNLIAIDFLIGMPDTAASGDQWLVGGIVRNFSASTPLINDSVQIVGYFDSLSGPVSPFALPWEDSISIAPGDTLLFVLPIDFTAGPAGNGLRIGNNVIVVWPITPDPSFDTGDSISVNVFILDGISTGPEAEIGEIRCYPVPASGPLYVTSSNRHMVVKEITVRDASGKIIVVSNNPSSGILTDDWAAGIYMLEVTFENGKRSAYKIIR